MRLFNKKTLDRHLQAPKNIPKEHLEHLEKWSDLIESGRVFGETELGLQAEFKSKIVQGVLGYQGIADSENFTVASEQTIIRGSVDLALGNFAFGERNIVAPFELKGAQTKDLDAIMPGRSKTPVQQAWEYATNEPGVKWVIVSNMVELRLYGFGEGTQAYEQFELARLIDPSEYARFMLLLSEENLLSGKSLELLRESRQEDKDITDALYADYKALRSTLIFAIRKQKPDLAPLESIGAAQTILDRVLFTAFAEDTSLLPRNILEKAFENSDPFNPRPVWDNFKGLFNSINSGNTALNVPPYNGGLFAPSDVLDDLEISDDVCEKFKDIGAYDFASEISVTVLGHIFEQSISDVERLQAQARGEEMEPEKTTGTTGRRKRDGVVYTPDYIARFIVDQTLGTHLREIFSDVVSKFAQRGADTSDYENIKWRRKSAEVEAWEAYRNRLKTLRIVDPACGSGVFLVMAFDYMKGELERVNDKISEMRGIGGAAPGLFDPDTEILTNNLFGVDVNVESIELAKLSLWVKTAKRGKPLDSLDENLRVGDSLIEDSNYAYLSHGFTWKDAFPNVFSEGGFDIVLGNPPYVRMEHLKSIKPYLETRFEVVSDRADLYCYFFERGLRLLRPGGRLGYISSSTFFKTGSGKPLRDFLRSQATIESVVDFGDLQVFEGVTTYPAILTMRREKPNTKHTLRYWNVEAPPETNFRATFASKADPYPQADLSSGSWELENSALKALRDKIRKGRKSLGEVYGLPLYGIKTGLNDAFIIDTATKNQLCADDPKSTELLKPFLEGKDLKRWRSEPRGLWLIYIPKNRVDIDVYPAIRDWLTPFKDRLENRATKQKWFELQQAQESYAPHFKGHKIAYKDIGDSAPFHIEKEGHFLANTGYFIPSNEGYLTAYLNSKLLWFTYVNVSAQIRGGFVRFFSNHLAQMPVPSPSDSQKSRLTALADACQKAAKQRYTLQLALTRRIPDLGRAGKETKLSTKLREWWLLPDFAAFRAEVRKTLKAEIPLAERSDWEDWIARDKVEIDRLTTEIHAKEDCINSIIYELFQLTTEEIELLESSI